MRGQHLKGVDPEHSGLRKTESRQRNQPPLLLSLPLVSPLRYTASGRGFRSCMIWPVNVDPVVPVSSTLR